MTLEAVLTYTLIAEVFAEPLSARTELAWTLFTGNVATRFLWPIGVVWQFAAEAAGRWAVGLALFSLPLLLVAPWLGARPWPSSPAAGVLFLASLVLAVVVGLAIEFIFGGLVVALQEGLYAIDRVRGAVTALLSGAVIPLALLPWGLDKVFNWLPFAAMASAPLRIYTGSGDPLPLLLSQAAWALLLWPLANWLWRANREQLTGYGG
jgi:ABC-type uncharacterized transport system permease subunit